MALLFRSPRLQYVSHLNIPRPLTFTLTGTFLKVAGFSPFILLGISVSASLFAGSNGNHMSPLAVSDCVDDIYACLSVRVCFFLSFFFFSVPCLRGVRISLSRTFLQFQSADMKALTRKLLENNRKRSMRSPS